MPRAVVPRGRARGAGPPARGSVGLPPFVEHLGGGAGFWTDSRLFPALGLGLVVMWNATSYDHEAIGGHVLRHWAAPATVSG